MLTSSPLVSKGSMPSGSYNQMVKTSDRNLSYTLTEMSPNNRKVVGGAGGFSRSCARHNQVSRCSLVSCHFWTESAQPGRSSEDCHWWISSCAVTKIKKKIIWILKRLWSFRSILLYFFQFNIWFIFLCKFKGNIFIFLHNPTLTIL